MPMRHVPNANRPCHTCQRVMCHRPTSRVTHTNESCRTYQPVTQHIQRVTPHIRMRHVTHTNESCHTHQRVVSHISSIHTTHLNQSHTTRPNTSCHTNQRVVSHKSTNHITRLNKSRQACSIDIKGLRVVDILNCRRYSVISSSHLNSELCYSNLRSGLREKKFLLGMSS